MRSAPDILGSLVRTLNLLTEVGASEVYRAQAQGARDPKTATVLRRIQAHEATHVCETRARVAIPDPIRVAGEATARAGGRLLGGLTALGGDRAALAFDMVLESFVELAYRTGLLLLPRDARPSDRAVLRRALEEEREHKLLIRDRLGV